MSPTKARRILFVGDCWLGSNARSLAVGLRAAGNDVVQVDTTRVSRPRRYSPEWAYARLRTKRCPSAVGRVHDEIEAVVRDFRPDTLVAFKTIHLQQDRLLSTPVPLKIHYSADDVSNPANLTDAYLRYEDCWDLIVTTKRHNVPELQSRGVRNVRYVWSAYDPAWHHPVPVRGQRRFLVGFVGNMRPDRARLILELARMFGDEMLVSGPGWRRLRNLMRTAAVVQDGAYGEDLAYEISRCEVNLVLLNSDNRDQHTCRSFEVPASAGLFVGERTDEHRELIEDGVSGFHFDGSSELIDVIRRVVRDPKGARRVALEGHRQIVQTRNTYRDRAVEMLAGLDLEG